MKYDAFHIQRIPPLHARVVGECAPADMLPEFLRSSHLGCGQKILGSRPMCESERDGKRKNEMILVLGFHLWFLSLWSTLRSLSYFCPFWGAIAMKWLKLYIVFNIFDKWFDDHLSQFIQLDVVGLKNEHIISFWLIHTTWLCDVFIQFFPCIGWHRLNATELRG